MFEEKEKKKKGRKADRASKTKPPPLPVTVFQHLEGFTVYFAVDLVFHGVWKSGKTLSLEFDTTYQKALNKV